MSKQKRDYILFIEDYFGIDIEAVCMGHGEK